MALALRQPFRLTSAVGGASSKNFLRSAPARAFHHSKPTAAPKVASKSRSSASSSVTSPVALVRKNAFQQSRTYMQQQQQSVVQAPSSANGGNLMFRLLVGGGLFAGTLLATNVIFNRETREDGGMPVFERKYLNETFLHTGLGVGIIGLSAVQLLKTNLMYRIMATNPMVVVVGSLALSIGTMMGTRNIDPSNYVPKYAMWTAFNVTQGAIVAPLLFMAPPALIARAGLYTAAMMGSIAFVGATAKQEKYLYLGGPLLAGVAVVAVSGFAPLVLPATAVRTLAVTENLWLYGGLAVFGGFTLYDVQKILHHARLAERGLMQRDAVNESISLEMDFLNIFIRMVQILSMQQNRRK